MRVVCLYRPNTEHERPVMELNRELERRSGQVLELMSVDTKEGSTLAEVYDVWQYPALLALDTHGVIHKDWRDGSLPLINELIYYLDS